MVSKCAVMFILVFAVFMTAPGAARAADSEEAAAGETERTAMGHIYVRAVVEKGYETDITVCLIPVSENGTVHEYRLNAENRYGLSDDVTEGHYLCVPFITDSLQDGTAYVEYGGGETEVTRGGDTVFVAVAGSAGFVRDYIWISGFRDENGQCLKGVISRREAEEAFQETIAGQREQPEATASLTWSRPEEAAAEGNAPPAPLSPAPEQETGTGGKDNMPAALPSAAAVCLAACAAAWAIRKKC